MTSRSEIQLGTPAPTVAVVALVALVAAILTAVVRNRPLAPDPPPEAATAELVAEPAIEPSTAAALIDAIPWGRIERIETAHGDRHGLPEQRDTPVLLELPPGEWRVALSNPGFDGERICLLSLTEGTRQDCLVEFGRLSVDQYFREAGWWR